MFKILLLFGLLSFLNSDNSQSQTIYDGVIVGEDNQASSLVSVIFCDKLPNEKSIISISIDELKNCDWRLKTSDNNFQITEFRISFIPKDKEYEYSEVPVIGNQIPEKFRDKITNHTARIFIEYIKAENSKKVNINLKALTVNIQ